MANIIKGYWDCPYCGNTGISGLSKSCPGCGRAQDAGTQFYLKEEKEVLEEEKAEQYGKGADWTCGYCNSLNRYSAKFCSNCGASREETSGDYFENKKRREEKEAAEAARKEELAAQNQPKAGMTRSKWIFLAVLLALIAIIVVAVLPKKSQATVIDRNWSRSIQIESYTTVQEEDWSVPEGGRVLEERSEIHHYNEVLDHYETVEVQRSRTVQNGYDYYTTYEDNGDGTFTEVEHSTPHYDTEYYTETEQQPVYVSIPQYATKYYYEIERWIPSRTVDTGSDRNGDRSSGDEEPYWGETELVRDEREGTRYEQYTVTLRDKKGNTYTLAFSQDRWDTFKKGQSVEVKIQTGSIISIDGVRVN